MYFDISIQLPTVTGQLLERFSSADRVDQETLVVGQ